MIKICDETTKNPITLIGEMAGPCYGSDTTDDAKNYKRGLSCINDGHGRVMEFPQVYMVISGYSARVIRELYTHIGGAPTRLQASTRYIDYSKKGFEYITPPSIAKDEGLKIIWDQLMSEIVNTLADLEDQGVPKEDVANGLPLGMTTTITYRANLRTLVDMSRQRLCTRAYWEYRLLMKELMTALAAYSPEWKTLVDTQFKCKCDISGYCLEHKTCGRKPTKEEFDQIVTTGINTMGI